LIPFSCAALSWTPALHDLSGVGISTINREARFSQFCAKMQNPLCAQKIHSPLKICSPIEGAINPINAIDEESKPPKNCFDQKQKVSNPKTRFSIDEQCQKPLTTQTT